MGAVGTGLVVHRVPPLLAVDWAVLRAVLLLPKGGPALKRSRWLLAGLRRRLHADRDVATRGPLFHVRAWLGVGGKGRGRVEVRVGVRA